MESVLPLSVLNHAFSFLDYPKHDFVIPLVSKRWREAFQLKLPLFSPLTVAGPRLFKELVIRFPQRITAIVLPKFAGHRFLDGMPEDFYKYPIDVVRSRARIPKGVVDAVLASFSKWIENLQELAKVLQEQLDKGPHMEMKNFKALSLTGIHEVPGLGAFVGARGNEGILALKDALDDVAHALLSFSSLTHLSLQDIGESQFEDVMPLRNLVNLSHLHFQAFAGNPCDKGWTPIEESHFPSLQTLSVLDISHLGDPNEGLKMFAKASSVPGCPEAEPRSAVQFLVAQDKFFSLDQVLPFFPNLKGLNPPSDPGSQKLPELPLCPRDPFALFCDAPVVTATQSETLGN
eukprot:GILI01019479.1.p1 GENE.GILI01019479.1~~GILI01019479.1.p1  ORF type:complete len:378 (-),score=60.98 GILI01019479.1:212-1252(-)